MAKKKILLIDDEEDLLLFTKLNLEGTGEFDVTTAISGEEGLKKAEETNFDLVITDYKMPGLDGAAVLNALKSKSSSPPVILFSIYHDDGSAINQFIRAKSDGIISKPIDHAKLYETIKRNLSKRKPA